MISYLLNDETAYSYFPFYQSNPLERIEINKSKWTWPIES